MKSKLIILLSLFAIYACTTKEAGREGEDTVARIAVNPAAEGFNLEGSDPKAMAWADAVMKAMGGREQWDNLRYLAWNFFGVRDLVWDKKEGRVRIDFPRDSAVYLANINTMTGKVQKNGEEVTHPDSLTKYLQRAKGIWINDSYWLVMPFKLKDSGVTLRYLRQDTMLTGTQAEVLELTFENVGNTPGNKYEVFIDPADSLVKQWAYFKEASQDSASAIWPWDNYAQYNGVLLSGDRSDNRGPKNVRVYDQLPVEVFESFDEPLLE